MEIHELVKCKECGKMYKGQFQMGINGRVVCLDCKNPKKYHKVQWKNTNVEEEGFLEALVHDLMKKDLKRIYMPKVVTGEDETHFLRDKDNNIDPKKVYFQNNEIEFVLEMHDQAYIALSYMETGKKRYTETVTKVLDGYLEMRNKKFNREEVKELKDLIESNDMTQVRREVERL